MRKGYTHIAFLKILGAQVHIHWSALLVLGALSVSAISAPLESIVVIFSYFGIILLHETGHAFVASRLGCRPWNIYLGIVHGLCEHEEPYSRKHDAMIAWGGVLAQFAVAIPLIVLGQVTDLEYMPGFGAVIGFLGYISFLIAIFNLAPAPFLDGGKAWSLIPIILQERRTRSSAKSGNPKNKKQMFRIIK